MYIKEIKDPFSPNLIIIGENLQDSNLLSLFMEIPKGFGANLIEGKYGIAIGYKEEFTLSEWLLIPFDVIGIHQWEGQQLLWILALLLLSLVLFNYLGNRS